MKALKFLGIGLLVVAGLNMAAAVTSMVVRIWVPTFLPYDVVNPMAVFWGNLAVSSLILAFFFGAAGGALLGYVSQSQATTDDLR